MSKNPKKESIDTLIAEIDNLIDKLFTKLRGMKGGLVNSAEHGKGRDPASGQLKTVEELLEITMELKEKFKKLKEEK